MSTRFAVTDWRTKETVATYRDRGRAERFVQSQISVGAENGAHLFVNEMEAAA